MATAGDTNVEWFGQNVFQEGIMSQLDPTSISEKGYRWGINITNRGGFISTRPGYQWIATLAFPREEVDPGTGAKTGKIVNPLIQGMTHFKTFDNEDYIVVVVDGVIWFSKYPFTSFSRMTELMRPDLTEVYFCVCEKSNTLNDDGSVRVLDTPVRLLVIQDGRSVPVVWDGLTQGRRSPKIPQGGAMAWSGNRLWVSVGPQLYASDIGNPEAFKESEYLGMGGSFLFPLPITAMAETPADANDAQLVVFTATTTSLVKSSIRKRDDWATTVNFISSKSNTIGCVSPRSVSGASGLLWWMSRDGLVNYDVARAMSETSYIPVLDSEMALSKGRLLRDLSSVAVTTFANQMLVSVPYGGNKNQHTWVLDLAGVSSVVGARPRPCWASIWTGTNPAAWVSGYIGRGTRCYHVSSDNDGAVRIWEVTADAPTDNGVPIPWLLETRGFSKDGWTPMKMQQIEARFTGLRDPLDLAIFYAPAWCARYTSLYRGRLNADVSEMMRNKKIPKDNSRNAASQFRHVKTTQGDATLKIECSAQTDKPLGLSPAFSFVFTGVGRMSLIAYRGVARLTPYDSRGECKDGDATVRVLADGTDSETDEWNDLHFTTPIFSHTATVNSSAESGVPVKSFTRSADSPVSEAAAERLATASATAVATEYWMERAT